MAIVCAGRKRNVIDYDHASAATHTEAEDIVAEAESFFCGGRELDCSEPSWVYTLTCHTTPIEFCYTCCRQGLN
jgi:hypothetical protein